MDPRPPSRRKPFFIGLAVGVLCGLALGSTLAALFGSDALSLSRRLAARLAGERDEPNFELLLQ